MRLWLPTNPLWYIAALILFGPFVIEAVLGPSWIVKLISISFLILGIPLLLFFFCAHQQIFTIDGGNPFCSEMGKATGACGNTSVLFNSRSDILFEWDQSSERY
jgi:hypothetical protein